MKIVTTTEVFFTLEDLEKLIREKEIIPGDLKLENFINVPSPRGLRLIFTKSTGTISQINNNISDEEKERFLDTSFFDMNLRVNTINCLKAADIKTPRDFSQYSETGFKKLRNLGKKGLKEITDLMAQHGVSLKEE